MSDPRREPELPPRLHGARGPEGELVRRYLRRAHRTSEERAWDRLEEALLARSEGPRPRPWGALAALAGAAALAGVWLMLLDRGNPGGPPAGPIAAPFAERAPGPHPLAPAPPTVAPAPAPPPPPTSEERPLALGARARPVAPGRWTIPGEATLELTAASAARARAPAGRSPALALDRGRIALAVVPRPRPAPFQVTAGPYLFTVLGTRFTVERDPRRITLQVSEGHVAVSRAGRRLAMVSAGGSWSGTIAAPPAGSPPPPSEQPREPVTAEVDCAQLATGQPRLARLPCLRAQAAGSGLRAQIALFEIGRINQEDLAQPAGALATFEELRRRFPRGPLRAESDLSIVQLLAATGRHHEALEESAALLARGSGPERSAELRLLRGNLYREAFGDLARAEREYRMAAAQALNPQAAGQATFLHAVTLEALGRRAEAADGYRRYLARERPARASEARARLERLDQTSTKAPGSK